MSKYVNVIDGMRVTVEQPENFKGRVHIFGASIAYGFGVEDRYTLASCIQRLLNEQEDEGYKVFNYGVRGLPLEEYVKIIKDAKIYKKDHILCTIPGGASKECKEALLEHKCIVIDLSDYFQHPHEYGEVFFDDGHFNYKGYIVSADIIFRLIFNNPKDLDKKEKLYKKNDESNEVTCPYDNNKEFISYMKFLDSCSKKIDKGSGEVRGGVVINANPFTLGHYHLIEIASKMVDYLYVFVVEEDCSDFSFSVRYDLVVKGTKTLQNVIVIPSGKFIISNITFPEYFDKNNRVGTKIIPSLDIELFGKFIAKKLGISIRFVGEEREDFVTCQYNRYMKEKLPLYGIKLIEIPRLKKDGEVISASRVRSFISVGKFEEARELVPLTTYQYIEEHIKGKIG